MLLDTKCLEVYQVLSDFLGAGQVGVEIQQHLCLVLMRCGNWITMIQFCNEVLPLAVPSMEMKESRVRVTISQPTNSRPTSCNCADQGAQEA